MSLRPRRTSRYGLLAHAVARAIQPETLSEKLARERREGKENRANFRGEPIGCQPQPRIRSARADQTTFLETPYGPQGRL